MMKKLSCILIFLFCLMPLLSFGAESKCLEGNCITGKGVKQYEEGDKYSGEFKEGKRSGHGTLISENGRRYEGEWLNDL